MLVVFGDVHFSDERSWSKAVGQEFISFLQKCPDNDKSNVGLFLGDITEKASISPLVYEMVFEFLGSLKFKKTYILRGNHDVKKKKGRVISPLSFLDLRDSPYPNVTFVSKPRRVVEEGIPLILLPFRGATETPSMDTYKESLNPFWYEEEKALVCGHFADSSNELVRDSLIDLSKFKGEIVLGHIHNPLSKNYIGAVVPNAVSEKNVNRVYRVYETNKKYEAKPIPKILDYYDIQFPDPLTKVEASIPVYTVHNCNSLESARNLYGDVHIRKCIYDAVLDVDTFNSVVTTSTETSLTKIITLWLTSQPSITEALKEKILSYLHTT